MNGFIKQRMRAPNNDQAREKKQGLEGRSMGELNSESLETGRTWREWTGEGRTPGLWRGGALRSGGRHKPKKGETEEIYYLSGKHLSARTEWEMMK